MYLIKEKNIDILLNLMFYKNNKFFVVHLYKLSKGLPLTAIQIRLI